MKKVYSLKVRYDNDIEKLQKALTWYFLIKNLSEDNFSLQRRLIEILAYYVHLGYSDETKKFIMEAIPEINRQNLTQMNYYLTKMGCLLKDGMRDSARHLEPNLQKLRDYVLNNTSLIFAVTMEKNP